MLRALWVAAHNLTSLPPTLVASLLQRKVFLFADQAELDMPSEEEIKATGADAPESLAYKVGWRGVMRCG